MALPRYFRTTVEGTVKTGKLWRAKEITGATLRQFPYEPELYELHGIVLLRMGDLVEAGKYLFLSGERKVEYDEAIALYLSRHGSHGWRGLVSTFPRSARHLTVASFPASVQEELLRLETPVEHGRDRNTATAERSRGTLKEKVGIYGCIAVVVLAAWIFVLGLNAVFRMFAR